MKYRNFTIKKSGFNFLVITPAGFLWSKVASSIATAKKWIDAALVRF